MAFITKIFISSIRIGSNAHWFKEFGDIKNRIDGFESNDRFFKTPAFAYMVQ